VIHVFEPSDREAINRLMAGRVIERVGTEETMSGDYFVIRFVGGVVVKIRDDWEVLEE
jgi:hypothetical protein